MSEKMIRMKEKWKKMRNKKIFIGFLISCFSSLLIVVLGPENVFAGKTANVYNYINNKAYYQGIYNCYSSKYSQKKNGHYYDVKGSVQLDEVKNIQSFVYDIAYYYQPFAKKETNGCKTVFANFSKKPNTTSAESIKNFVEGMGYKIDTSDGTTCYGLSFTKDNKKKVYNSNMICPDRNDRNNGFKSVGSHNNGVRLYVESEQPGGKSAVAGSSRKICLTVDVITEKSNKCKDVAEGKNLSKGLVEGLVKDLCGIKCVGNSNKSKTLQNFKATKQKMEGGTAKVGGRKSAASKAIEYLSGNKYKNTDAVKISEIEKRLLYQSYLNYYGVDVSCKKEAKATSDGSIKWYTNGKIKTCYYSTTNAKNKDAKLNGVTRGGFLKKGSITGLEDALAKTKGLKSSYSKDELDLAKKIVGGEFNEKEEGEKDSNDKENECQKQSGAMGWVFCPIIENVSKALYAIYDEVVQPFLVIDPDYFEGTDSGTYMAWEIFRNFANIAFVIMFLVVIFSQLTGIGIDNYGIKRILPKLIVVAILINLSYIICEVLIDISNILGSGLSQLFTGVAKSIDNNATSPAEYFNRSVNTVISAVGLAAVGTVTAFTVITAITSGWSVIAPILLGLLSVLIAVLFMFVILFVRRAAAILLVAVAPLAFVSYVLPNTKRAIFDKWLGIFKGVLLMYPIAGMLIGGGLLASSIIVGTVGSKAASDGGAGLGEFFLYLGGLLLQVVPFFFLPKIFRQSLNAIGNLGDKITSGGKAFSGGVNKRIRENEGYQMMQARLAAGKNGGLRQKIASKMPGSLGKNAMARNLSRVLSYDDKAERANELLADGGVGFEAASIAQRKKAESDMVSNYVTTINDATRNGEEKDKLYSLYERYNKDGNKYGMAAVARIAGRRKDTADDFSRKVVSDSANYNSEMLKAVSKEMATGENSGIYRQSSPLGFEFASQVNSGKARTSNYEEWLGQKQLNDKGEVDPNSQSNASLALEHHVTNAQELVGMKGKELDDLYSLMENGTIDAETSARISNLATQAIENRDKPGSTWDSTKADQLAHISGKYRYDSSTDSLTLNNPSNIISSSSEGATSGFASSTGVAREGETFNVKPVNNSEEYIEHQQYRRPPKSTP